MRHFTGRLRIFRLSLCFCYVFFLATNCNNLRVLARNLCHVMCCRKKITYSHLNIILLKIMWQPLLRHILFLILLPVWKDKISLRYQGLRGTLVSTSGLRNMITPILSLSKISLTHIALTLLLIRPIVLRLLPHDKNQLIIRPLNL